MLFNGRRQSRDEAVCRRMLSIANGSTLWMNAYSSGLFQDLGGNIRVHRDYLDLAADGEYCFVESDSLQPRLREVEEVTVFRWNRVYPSDVQFPTELFNTRWKMTSREEFSGKSHQRITQEVYSL